MDTSRPPRMAEQLLGAVIRDADWRDSVLGDLREEFAGVSRRRGGPDARRWYWRQALSIGARRLVPRRVAYRRMRRWPLPDPASPGTWRTGMNRDVTYAWRAVLRQGGTSAVIVATLALALASNSVSFAMLDALVLRPFRFPDVDRVVMVVSSDPQQGLLDRESVTPADFREWREGTRTISPLAAAEWWDANLSGVDQPEQVQGHRVTAGYFEALGVTPILGRTFTRDEEVVGNHRRAVIAHSLWTRLFDADPAVVGRTIRIDGEPYDVVGVAPAGFQIPYGTQVWSPLAKTADDWNDRRGTSLITVGRLVPGATLSDARAEVGAMAERQRREHPDTNAERPNAVVTFTDGMQDAGAGRFLSLILAASALLLLIACANIANLLLARGADRVHEFALRVALGGRRLRLAGQLLIEAGLLAAAGLLLAMPVAMVGLALAKASIPAAVVRFVPGFAYIALSPTVFVVTAACAVAATALFALVPALQTVRRDVADTLRQGGRTLTSSRRRNWLRQSLAAAQVALTVALVFCAGLMLGAHDRAINGATGFDRRGVLIAIIALPEQPYRDAETRRQFIGGVLDRLEAIPAVADAAMVSNLPYGGNNNARPFWPADLATDERSVRSVDYRRATPEYFDTLRIPLLRGRLLTAADREGAPPVAVVSQSLVERYWPDGDAIGKQFRFTVDGEPITIVGVVGDVLHDWFQQRRAPTVYRPLGQDAPYRHALVIRTVGDPLNLAGDLRRAVAAEDPDQPVMSLQTLEQLMEDRTGGIRALAGMMAVVAGIALALALMGLYSLMAYIVSRRTQELGVRLALGATRSQVVMQTTRQGAWVVAAGLAIGAGVAFAIGRVMESVLFGIVIASAVQLALLVLVVAAVSLLASYLPARRTAQLDPAAALRDQY